MISVIICSRSQVISDRLALNIKSTIGVSYEMVIIDNSLNKYSIFEAYNLGMQKSVGTIVCFLHEDIILHTPNWGSILKEKFLEDNNLGLIGVAGGHLKTKMPSNWWHCPVDGQAVNVIQHQINGKIKHWNSGFSKKQDKDAVVVDGVFMAQRRNESIRFSTELSGFHHYDMNLSLENIFHGYRVIITNAIVIEHFSPGNVDRSWIESALQFYRLYNEQLPISIGNNLSINEIKRWEFNNGRNFINQLLKFGYKKEAVVFWIKLLKIKPFSKFHLHFILSLFNL